MQQLPRGPRQVPARSRSCRGCALGRIHVIDAKDPPSRDCCTKSSSQKKFATGRTSGPHTVHCLPDGRIMLSMLGDGQGNAPGGFLLLDEKFEIAGRWDPKDSGLQFNYDFWYQPRHNVMVSSEWAAPNTFQRGFDVKDVEAGKYGHSLCFWDWTKKQTTQAHRSRPPSAIPLEVRFHHNPDSTHGFVGAAPSSTLWHWFQDASGWQVDKVVEVPAIEAAGWPFPVPGLITDLLVSMDDRFLYFSNWLHGDLRQYDITDPRHPKLTAQLWLGGVLGKSGKIRGQDFIGGPQMLQLSLDGRRLYVTNSLFSSWDQQFYPAMTGARLDDAANRSRHAPRWHAAERGFLRRLGAEPHGPARAHEMRFPGGDCTSDIWV